MFIHVLFEKTMFYLYFSLFNKNIHEVKNIAIRIVSCHTYRDTYRIVKMCIVTSLVTASDVLRWNLLMVSLQPPAILGEKPKFCKARPVPYALQPRVEKALKKMESEDIIGEFVMHHVLPQLFLS